MKKSKKVAFAGVLVSAVAMLAVVGPAGPADATPHSSGKGCTANVYARGSVSTCVGYIQRMLNGINRTYGSQYGGFALTVDNNFGANTDTQVRRFQKWELETADGIVGPRTWNDLCFRAGQSGFWHDRRGAWDAAYAAGCVVEKPVYEPSFHIVQMSRY